MIRIRMIHATSALHCSVVVNLVIVSLLAMPSLGVRARGQCELSRDCRWTQGALNCDNCIPTSVPNGTVNVTVRNNTIPMTEHTFSHVSWQSIKLLDVHEDDGFTNTLHRAMFANLIQLQQLGLHLQAPFTSLTSVGNGTLSGLVRLQRLDLSECGRFSFDLLYQLLDNRRNFPNLNALAARHFNYVRYGTMLDLNSTFLEILGERKIQVIDVERSTLKTFYGDPSSPLCSSLREIRAKNIILITYTENKTDTTCSALRYLDLSGFQSPSRNQYMAPKNTFRQQLSESVHKYSSLQQKLSYQQSRFVATDGSVLTVGSVPTITVNLTDRDSTLRLLHYTANVQTLKIDRVIQDTIVFRTIIILEREGSIDLRNISLQNNGLKRLDIVFQITIQIHIESIDLSYNNMEYIGPLVFANISTIKHLILAHNNLSCMSSKSDEMVNIFAALSDLKDVDLTYNALESLPRKFFTKNKNLRTINLSQNKLTGFLQSGTFRSLRLIDLSNNKIVYLDKETRQWFESMRDIHTAETGGFVVDLRDNPIQCTCEVLDFPQWLLDSDFIIKDTPPTCIWKGHSMVITKKSLRDLHSYCNRSSDILRYTLFSLGGLVVSFTVLISSTVLCKRFHRKRRQRNKRDNAILKLRTDAFDYRFISFLVYSSLDSDVVLGKIHPLLLNCMREITGRHSEYICIGDQEFRPGRSIFNETYRCLEESASVIVVVSENFSESIYCRNELEQAMYMEKPVVLCLLGEPNINNMVPLIQQLFHQNVRVKIEMVHDEPVFTPTVNNVCMSILELVD